MEFLFTNQIASIEAILLFLCLLTIGGIFAFDGFVYARTVLAVFFPKRISPIIPDIQKDNIKIIEDSEPINQIPSLETPQVEISSGEIILENNIEEKGIAEIPQEIIPDTVVDLVSPGIESSSELQEDQKPIISSSSLETEDLDPAPVVLPSENTGDDAQDQSDTGGTKEKKKKRKYDTHNEDDKKASNDTPTKNHRTQKKDKLIDILTNIKTLIARGQVEDARALIVSGLAIDKNHRELNILMASLYERDHAYKKAEYILKDIAISNPDDIEILTHLATDLAMQGKYDVSYELYKRILVLGDEGEETLYTLTHLASELGLPLDVSLYGRAYLKQFPHNPEILWLYAQSQITNGERKQAVETLIKLKNLTPYNQEIADLIQKLVTEEELAGNFGGEKS